MFKKPVRVKSNNRMKGSERKRLKQNVLNQYRKISEDQLATILPNKEDIFVTKIETQSGLFITCYCCNKNPLFFEIDKEKLLYPSVYTLWQLPELTAYMVTWPNVFGFISRGADLMLPGVVTSYGGFDNIEKGDIVSVRLAGNKSTVAVGVAMVSSNYISEFGMKGKGVSICHWYTDNLWSMGDASELPVIADDVYNVHLDDTYSDDMAVDIAVSSALQELNTADTPSPNDNIHVKTPPEESGKSEQPSSDEYHTTDTVREDTNSHDMPMVTVGETLESNGNPADRESMVDDNEAEQVEEHKSQPVVLTPEEEMDLLVENCFLQALLDAKRAEFPILVTSFSSQYLHPACPEGKKIDIKKSRYRKMAKFLQAMEDEQLIKVGELSKGVLSILEINLQNEKLREYKSGDFAKEKSHAKAEAMAQKEAEHAKEGINVIEMFAVSGTTRGFFKIFDCSKGQAFTSPEVRKMLTNYVKEQELVNKTNKKLVNLDPILSDVLFDKNFRQDSVTWDVLLTRFLEKMNSCHKVMIKGKESAIRKGKMEPVEVKLEQRMGNKKVTLVKNLEQFGVDPNEFAHRIQLAAASSTTVSQLPGKNASGMQVLIQGNQSSHVSKLLDELAIPKKYITGLEKLKSKGKKR